MICFVLCLSLYQFSFADLSINNFPVNHVEYKVNPYSNGNSIAKANNIELKGYIASIYSGYKVNLNGIKDIKISINDKVPNNAVSILSYLSEKYGLNFIVDNHKDLVTISLYWKIKEIDDPNYQSIMKRNKKLSHENKVLEKEQKKVSKDMDHMTSQMIDINKKISGKVTG
jgi:hypothetical protein